MADEVQTQALVLPRHRKKHAKAGRVAITITNVGE